MNKTFEHKHNVATISDHYTDLIDSAQTVDSVGLEAIRQYLKPRSIFSGYPTEYRNWWHKIWSLYIKYTTWIVAPLKAEDTTVFIYRLPIMFLVLWFELIALIYSILVFGRITGVYIARPSTVPQTEAMIFTYVFRIVVPLIMPAIYNYGVKVLFNKKRRPIWRTVFVVFLFIVVVVILLFPTHELQLLKLGSESATVSSTLHHYVGNGRAILDTAFTMVIVLIPSLIYVSLLFIDAILWLIWGASTISTYFFLFHTSHPMEKIQKLVYGDIQQKNDKEANWKLVECEIAEIDAIQKWAEANREGTEKRLIPTIIFFSLIQLFGWNAISNTLAWQRVVEIGHRLFVIMFSGSFWGIIVSVLVGSILGVLLAPFILVGQLFSNILPQSLIIEACIVAQYTREKEIESTHLLSTKEKIQSRFIDRLAYLLGYTSIK